MLDVAVREPKKEDKSAELVFCCTAKGLTVIVRWQAVSVGRRLPQVLKCDCNQEFGLFAYPR
jgi:hypothetical protein